MTSNKLLDAALRQDLNAFIQKSFDYLNPASTFHPNWHIEAVAHQLSRVAAGECRRLIICLPPRHLKSHMASVAFPAWLLGRNPSLRLFCISYSKELAETFGRQCHDLMHADFYARVFPTTRLRKHGTPQMMETTQHGFRLATSTGGGLTGRGADGIIIDDPIKADDALSDAIRNGCNTWYSNTLVSRLNSKTDGFIVIVMQRLHTDDLVGYVQTLDDWTVVAIPAIASTQEEYPIGDGLVHVRQPGQVIDLAREPLEALKNLERSLSPALFSAQYQMKPVPLGGNLIRPEWFRRYREIPDLRSFDYIAQSWDTAYKTGAHNDFSACTTWGAMGDEFWLIDVFRAKLEYPHLKEAVRRLHQQWASDVVLIEEAGAGFALYHDLRPELGLRVATQNPSGDKQQRLMKQMGSVANQKILLPVSAPWLDAFLDELLAFPVGGHDDQIDSMEAFLRTAHGLRARASGVGRKIPRGKKVPFEGNIRVTILGEERLVRF